jgi:hypothetical protein
MTNGTFKVLSKEESFDIVLQKFARLKERTIIDLVNLDARFAAIVISVNRQERSFEVLPLDIHGINSVLSGKLPVPVMVQIPLTSDEPHPCWNEIGR